MLKSFTLRIPDWIHFGIGKVNQVGEEARRLGAQRVMILTDPVITKIGILDRVLESLKKADIDYGVFDQVEPEPPISSFMEALKMARGGKFDVPHALAPDF